MKSPLWYRLALLLSAYFPLFLIFIIKFVDHQSFYNSIKNWDFKWTKASEVVNLTTSFIFVLSCICCFYIIFEIFRTKKRSIGQINLLIKNVQSRDKDILVYLTAYVLPLVSLGTKTIQDVIVFLLLIVLILWLSLRSDLLYINPLIALLGIRIYEVETSMGNSIMFSTSKQFEKNKGKQIICYRLEGKSVLIDGTREGG
ncbi:hypothetical protein IQ283_05125 [Alkalihalobacillus hwajinpoensis]|uniref:hypothetical protein n=1 Tax=Guptibacillus hwajinpoensis TaxID=208199 RepID=UPI0018837176|nr:hypothetical protein [Pseudalkalibacillus hwajinpoensis]MBF0705982.1 hypothetical protein [Pseudalkalibacillus hwajinpoensis]